MSDNIEEQIAKIMADAPTIEDHLAPYRQRIAALESQLSARSGLTNPKRKAIHRELNRHRQYVSQFIGGRKATAAASPREVKKEKATRKKLRWLGRKADQTRSQKSE